MAFEHFANGFSGHGPYWVHVLGYWKARLEWPHRVLLLRYEDLQTEPIIHVKTLVEFMGHHFSLEEDQEGVVHKIIKLCSFKNFSNLEVNKMEHLPLPQPVCVQMMYILEEVRLEIGRII